MVIYFKKQTMLITALGALAGFLLAVLLCRGYMARQPVFGRAFVVALPAFAGAVIGRILAARAASVKLKGILDILYEDDEPERFFDIFEPFVKRIPDTNVEYIDGMVKLAYACEAMGEFDRGLRLLEGLEPERLRLHALAGKAILLNQRLCLYLLSENLPGGEEILSDLQELAKTAERRAPSLAANLRECIRLADNWMKVLKKEPADTAYLREEASLAKNRIHKREMESLLARALMEENPEGH